MAPTDWTQWQRHSPRDRVLADPTDGGFVVPGGVDWYGALRSASLERVSDFKGAIPLGWPTQVDAPGTNGGEWEQSAAKWLFEQVPGEWRDGRNGRQYRQAPIMLARDTLYLLGGQIEGLRAAYRTARVELADHFEPQQIDEQLRMYADEGPRLEALRRQVQLVHDALTGVRWVPKAPTSWTELG